MNTNEVQPGRELDALIAENVMGLKHSCLDGNHTLCGVKSYSTDISAAWEVVEKLVVGREVGLDRWPGSKLWLIIVREGNLLKARLWAETAPLAICRAALKTVQA